MADPYRQQIGPQSMTEALRGASPDAFGAQVGAAIERGSGEVGDAEAQARERQKQQVIQNELADATVQVERFSATQDATATAARDTALPGAAGYTAGLLQAHDDGAKQILGEIGNPEVRQHVEIMLERRRAQAEHDGETYEAVARGLQRTNDLVELRNVAVGRAAAPGLTDAERMTVRGQVIESVHGLMANIGGPPEARVAHEREVLADVDEAMLRSMTPQSARAALDSGQFDRTISPDARQSLNGWIDAGLRREEATARSAAEAQAAVGRAAAGNLVEDVNGGVQVDPARIDTALAEARAGAARGGPGAAAYESQVHDLERAQIRNLATRQYEPLSQDDRRAAMRAIEARPDWRADPNQVEAHAQLERLIQRDDGSIAGGRLERWSRNTNHPLAPFELGNAQGSAGRLAQAQAVAGYDHGPPQLLTDDEADHYRQEWQAADPGARATMLAQMGAHGPAAARAIAMQLAGPARPEMAALIDLASMRDQRWGGAVAREALDGEAAPLDPRLFPQAHAQTVIRQRFGAALAGRDGAQVAGITRVAGGIYAHRARLGNLDRFDPDLFASSFEAAMGRAGDTGGLAQGHSGGSFTLPRGMTSNDFFEPLQNSRAILVGRFSAGHAAPIWHTPDGDRRLSPTQVATMFTPVLVYDDNRVAHYQFRSQEGGFLQRSDGGGVFTVDMRALSHAYMHARGHR